jgi:hypothetical protein
MHFETKMDLEKKLKHHQQKSLYIEEHKAEHGYTSIYHVTDIAINEYVEQ